MTLRRLFFWLHLSVGLVVALLVAFLAVTGSIISFQTQLVARAERGIHPDHPAATPCVPPSNLLANAAAAATPKPLTSLTVFADPHQPAQVQTGNDGSVLLADACTGEILGPGANRLRVLLTAVRELHHQATFAGVRHETLRTVKNAAALAFVFLVLSGLVVWFPRRFAWPQLRPSVLFRPGLHGRAREWNLHNVAGFWLCLPLLAISTTGVIMAFPWANALLFRAAGEAPPPPHREAPPARQPNPAHATQPDPAALSDQRNPAPPARQPNPAHAKQPDPAALSDQRNPAGLANQPNLPGSFNPAGTPDQRHRHPAAPASGDAPASSATPRFSALDTPIAHALAFTPGISSVSLRLPTGTVQALTFQLTRRDRQPVLRDTLTLTPTDARVLKWEPLANATRGRRWRITARFLHTGELFGAPGQAVALLAALGALLLVWTGISLALRRLAAFRRRRSNQTHPTSTQAEQPVQVS